MSTRPSLNNEQNVDLSLYVERLISTQPSTEKNRSSSSWSQDLVLSGDEPIVLHLEGRRTASVRSAFFVILSVLSGGTILLPASWLPWVSAALRTQPCPLAEATHVLVTWPHGSTLVSVDFSATTPRMTVRGERLLWSEMEDRFIEAASWATSMSISSIPTVGDTIAVHGLSYATSSLLRSIFGPNSASLHEDSHSLIPFIFRELISPLNVFQAVSVVLWCLENYLWYPCAIVLIALASATSAASTARRNMRNLEALAANGADPVTVLRPEGNTSVSIDMLVPGDLFVVSDTGPVPCDCLLLAGETVVDESLLTGESVPVLKSGEIPPELTAVPVSSLAFSAAHMVPSNSTLYAGTRVLSARRAWTQDGSPPLVAMVLRTGGNTTKGILLKAMRYPPPPRLLLHSDALKFLGCTAAFAAVGFMASLVHLVRMGHMSWPTLLVRALDLITIVVPPALPASMAIGTAFALGRLAEAQILCISPSRINICGRISTVVFDKTGTLTDEALVVVGTHRVYSEPIGSVVSADGIVVGSGRGSVPSKLDSLSSLVRSESRMAMALATCHSLRWIRQEIAGDPLDLALFEHSGWKLLPPGTGGPTERVASAVVVLLPPVYEHGVLHSSSSVTTGGNTLAVVRIFDFCPTLRRSCVLVRPVVPFSGSLLVFAKGAPEAILPLCLGRSIPQGLASALTGYGKQGLRLLAVAGRVLNGVGWTKCHRLAREEVECDMDLLGLVVMENKLKSGVFSVISSLRNAEMGVAMATGDHLLTAIAVAREAGMVSSETPLFLSVDGFVWQHLDARGDINESEKGLSLPQALGISNCCFAMTGDVFDSLDESRRDLILHRSRVFARMSPIQKQRLVCALQARGDAIGFVGDGANDGGALKASDAGLSLTSPGMTTVVAPFSTHGQLDSLICLLTEGRCALATSFSCFKFMGLYSLIQFMTVSLLYVYGHTLGDVQFVYQDLIIILGLATCMSRMQPATGLSSARLPGRLVSRPILGCLIVHIFISGLFQLLLVVVLQQQPWWMPPGIPADGVSETNASALNTSLFCFSNFQFVIVALLFSSNEPFQASIFSNGLLMIVSLLLTAFNLTLLVFPSETLRNLFMLETLTPSFRMLMLSLVLLHVFVSYLADWAIGEHTHGPNKQTN